MERFGRLEKKQNKALKVFHKTVDQLSRIRELLNTERELAHKTIKTAEEAINEERQALIFISQKDEELRTKIEKISNILV